MPIKYLLLLLASVLLSTSLAPAALADDLFVEPNPSSGHFATIQEAVTEAIRITTANHNAINRILVRPGTYSGTITVGPNSNVSTIVSSTDTDPVTGTITTDTADTVLTGSQTSITLSGVSNLTIRNFSFEHGAHLTVNSGSSAVTVENIVFNLGGTGTAITVTNSSSTTIKNNTFYQAATAISSNSDLNITNNIFANNTVAAISASSLHTLPTYNGFYGNRTNGIDITQDPHTLPNSDHTGLDPLFVNAPIDFHLQSGSPAKGTGNPGLPNRNSSLSDMGAYGGPEADLPTPSTITGVTATLLSDGSVQISWGATSDTTITNYRVYYGTASRNTTPYPNNVLVPKGTTSTIVTPTAATPTTPAAPASVTLFPLNKGLRVSWSAVYGATGYRIYYSTTALDPNALPTPVPVNDPSATSYDLTGLTNGQPYFVAVQAVAQAQLFAAVTGVIDSTLTPAAGNINESPFSTETRIGFGPVAAGVITAAAAPATPEPTAPYPNLKGEGCFIATAAFGFYSAPQVQALRDFRDRYLMVNDYGRAFVTWYYRYGPLGARYLNAHPWLKAPVRVLLLPLVALSIFLVYTPPLIRVAVLMVVLVVGVYIFDSLKRRLWVGEVW